MTEHPNFTQNAIKLLHKLLSHKQRALFLTSFFFILPWSTVFILPVLQEQVTSEKGYLCSSLVPHPYSLPQPHADTNIHEISFLIAVAQHLQLVLYKSLMTDMLITSSPTVSYMCAKQNAKICPSFRRAKTKNLFHSSVSLTTVTKPLCNTIFLICFKKNCF